MRPESRSRGPRPSRSRSPSISRQTPRSASRRSTLTASSVTTASSARRDWAARIVPLGHTGRVYRLGLCPYPGLAGHLRHHRLSGRRRHLRPGPDVAHASQVRAGKATQQISFGNAGGHDRRREVRLTGQGSGRRPAIFRSDTPAVCTVSGPDLTPVAPGTCVVTASQGGNERFAPADMAATSQVRAGETTQDISFTLPAEMTVGEMVTLSAPTTSGLDGDVPLGHTAGVQRLGIHRHSHHAGPLRDHCRPGRQRRLRASARRGGRVPGPRRAGPRRTSPSPRRRA